MARLGSNPSKERDNLPRYADVRVIIPVYLPSLEGYYQHGLRVFEAMLDSIASTTDGRVLVTVIDNACGSDVTPSLERYLEEGRVDRLVRNRVNRGKVDAVLAEMRASYEEVLVVADADVVFRPGWVDAVLAGFSAFPECGLLSLHPAPDLRWYASSSILASARSRGARLVRAPLADVEDLERFAQSVGRIATEQPIEGQLVVVRDGHALMLGFAHFAFAVRSEAVACLPDGPSLSAENGVDAEYFELPADRAGWWCATVLWALAHHVGNTIDDMELYRIADFVASEVSESVGDLPPARRAAISRLLPETTRRMAARLTRSAYNLEPAAKRLFPAEHLGREDFAAIRVVPVDG